MVRTLVPLFAALLSTTALAGELRDDVVAQLDAIEEPPTRESLAALGDGVAAELIAIAQDSSATRTHRAKALHALGYFPSADSRLVLTTALDGGDSKLQRRAVHALANGWGQAAVADVTPALSSSDVQLRAAAAKALGRVGGPDARAALQQRLPSETEPMVREIIEAALPTSGQ